MSKLSEAKFQDPDEDERLVEACRKGDVESFGVLVEKYQKRMLNLAYRMTGDYEAACETVQETFLAAYRAISRFRGDAGFSTWLYEICLNQAKTRLKKERALSARRVFLDEPVEGEGEAPFTKEAPAGDPLPDEQLARKETQAKVQACIRELDEEYREVIILRDVQDMSYEEIGAVLHLRSGTVKSRLFRARDALRARLKQVFGELP